MLNESWTPTGRRRLRRRFNDAAQTFPELFFVELLFLDVDGLFIARPTEIDVISVLLLIVDVGSDVLPHVALGVVFVDVDVEVGVNIVVGLGVFLVRRGVVL